MAKKTKLQKIDTENLREYKAQELSIESLPGLGAHSYGIGKKIVNGKDTNKYALRIYVPKKRPLSQLSSIERVPGKISFFSRKLNKNVELVTDIVESSAAQFQPFDPEARHRPVPGGVSGGISAHTGTIGGWVWDNTDDTIVMLSNDHVFGHTAGDCIMQQGSADGGSCSSDRIGEVKRGIARSTDIAHPNIVDCAIGEPDNSAIYDLRVVDISPAVYAIEDAEIEMMVEKYGQTTRHTYGEITDIDWSGWVGSHPFEDCFRVDNRAPSSDWSAGGDSGSLVFSQDFLPDSEIKPVVGLHFAGANTYGVECKIQNVFNRLNLTTLCSGAFSAFIDSLFESESEGVFESDRELRISALANLATGRGRYFQPGVFSRTDRILYSNRGFYTGMARDVQDRLIVSTRGKMVNRFVDSNRSHLLDLIAKDRDIRRATILAFKPILAGVNTTTDLFEKTVMKEDIRRLKKLAREVSRKGHKKLVRAMKPIVALSDRAEGKTVGQILNIK